MMCEGFRHQPVLLGEVLSFLSVERGERVLDLTMGGGGHGYALCSSVGGDLEYWGVDRDSEAMVAGKKCVGESGAKCHFLEGCFGDIDVMLRDAGMLDVGQGGGFDVVLADLGVSSHQLDVSRRGFSMMREGPLDMRMSGEGESAFELLQRVSEGELADILYYYGDIRESRRLASALIREREFLNNTLALSRLCERVLGRSKGGQSHRATRVFQALRIAVNDEFGELGRLLEVLPVWCKAGCRLGIISFHSGEDRIVKDRFKYWSLGCECPSDFPVCVCKKRSLGKIIYSRGVVASEEELKENVRSRSARLRGFIFD